ncbi:MAG TPA: hypothetical protein VFA90_01560 [Terriglobales bacterium]|nr:hypothetical protein [Terriglobales bacterium]
MAAKPAAEPAQVADELFRQISQAIAALRQVVPQVSMAHNSSSPTKCDVPAVSLHDLAAAFARIVQMGNILSNTHSDVSAEIARALSHYKRLLWQFKVNLPRIQGWLLAERARLAARRSHSASVESWVRATQQTR